MDYDTSARWDKDFTQWRITSHYTTPSPSHSPGPKITHTHISLSRMLVQTQMQANKEALEHNVLSVFLDL